MLVKHDLSHDISHGRVLRQGNNGCHDDLPYEDAIVERWLSKAAALLCGKAVRLDIVGQSSKPCSPTAMPFTPTRPPAENTAEKQRVRQQMLARNWHDDAISPELGSFCQKSHLIAGLIDLS
jgi:hypothetical protein